MRKHQEHKAGWQCDYCELGKFNNQTGQPVCESCDAGSFADEEGMFECEFCDYGTYSNDSDVTKSHCVECEAGYYADDLGSTSCKDCPAGSKCPGKRTRDPIECLRGTYSKELASKPIVKFFDMK